MLKRMFSTTSGVAVHPQVRHAGDLDQYLDLLDQHIRPFAAAFYERLDTLLPDQFGFDWDRNAPDNPALKGGAKYCDRLSLEVIRTADGHHFKYGTGRVALRERHLFAKTVTWKTPKDFLHRFEVYQLIKEHFYDCTICKNRSKTRGGFTVKNSRQVITLEVFGENPKSGYLACDITLCKRNQPLAQRRMFRFLNFYGALYNHLENTELTFKTVPVSDVEFPDMDGSAGFV